MSESYSIPTVTTDLTDVGGTCADGQTYVKNAGLFQPTTVLVFMNAPSTGDTLTWDATGKAKWGPPDLSATYLVKANNLSDVASAATAATNLGLGTGNSPTFAGLTLTSPLPIASGGTNATTAANARTQLGAASSSVVSVQGASITAIQATLAGVTESTTGVATVVSGVIGAVSAVPATQGGTGLTSATLGDLHYASASNTISALSGNTTTTKKYLTQTGTGTASAAPAWSTIAAADLPVFVASGASHAPGAVPDPGASAGTDKFLREDATWQTVTSPAAANPTASVGLTAVNGSATTYMRSDGAPALSQSIAPTWTGVHAFSPAARSSGSAAYLTVTAPADTGLTASTEAIGVNFAGATRQHATGTITTQRDYVFGAVTHSSVAASTITTAATVAIAGSPVAGTNATLTNAYAIWVQSGKSRFAGPVLIPDGAVNGAGGYCGLNFGSEYDGGIATGFWLNGSGNLVCSASNVAQYQVNSAGLRLKSSLLLGWSSGDPTATGADAGIARSAAAVVKVTNGSTGSGWLQQAAARARNTADATNATATMASLSDLSITLIAGRKYTGRLVLFANNSTAAEGLQFDFNGGTATMTSFEAGFACTPPGSGLALGTLTATSLGTAITVTTATTGDAVYTIEFALVCNAAGTFIPRFAEVSHTSGAATVRLGSNLWIEDMPN